MATSAVKTEDAFVNPNLMPMGTELKQPIQYPNAPIPNQQGVFQQPIMYPTAPIPNQQGVLQQQTRQPARDISKEELWKIAHSADLTSLLGQPTIPPQPGRGLSDFNQTIPFDELDLTLLGLPSIRGGRRRDRDVPMQDPAAIMSGLHNIPDIASCHRNFSPGELEEWPLVDIVIHQDLIFIIIDAPGFDLQSYYFEEAEPHVLVMIGQKTIQAALPELNVAPPNIWVFRQRPRGNMFVRKIDLRRFNFNLDPTTLTYSNYNGCIVYRGLREQPVRPRQHFRYF